MALHGRGLIAVSLLLAVPACSPAPPIPAVISFSSGEITFSPNPGFVPSDANDLQLTLGEITESAGGVKYLTAVKISSLCRGGGQGCGAGGSYAFQFPLDLKTNVDYAIVVGDRMRSFVSYANPAGEFFVRGRRTVRTTVVHDGPVSDGSRLAAVFRIMDGAGMIE